MIKNAFLMMLSIAALTACGTMERWTSRSTGAAAPLGQASGLTAPGVQTAASLDNSTAAQKAAALAAPVAGARALGITSVALGNPAEQGFWLKSTLVSAPGKGKVKTASGVSVAVDLLPGTGGALLSLAAYRALGLALTDLPEVTVYAD